MNVPNYAFHFVGVHIFYYLLRILPQRIEVWVRCPDGSVHERMGKTRNTTITIQ